MTTDQLRERTKQFAIRGIRLVTSLPKNVVSDVLGHQFLKACTSVGANYREAARGTSRADFLAKIKIVEHEADESAYWLELMAAANLMPESRLSALLTEANELTAIFAAISRTTKRNSAS